MGGALRPMKCLMGIKIIIKNKNSHGGRAESKSKI